MHSVFNKLKDSYSHYWKTCFFFVFFFFYDSKNLANG